MENTELHIVTSSFEHIEELKSQNFILISIEGLAIAPKHKGLEMLRGFSTYQMRYHSKVQDYISCFMLYSRKLEMKGIDRIVLQLQELSEKYNSKNIALLGSGNSDEFCFRHIVSDFLQKSRIPVSEYKDEVEMEVQRQFWKYDPYKETGHHNLTDEFVGNTLEGCKWIFASTMAENPHHYTLRRDFWNDELFLSIVKHIRYFGEFEEFNGMMFRCWYYKNHKYFTHPADLTDFDTDLINHSEISILSN